MPGWARSGKISPIVHNLVLPMRTLWQPALTLVLIVTLMIAVPGSVDTDGQRTEFDRLFGLGQPDVFTLHSEINGQDFQIYVRLPREHQQSE